MAISSVDGAIAGMQYPRFFAKVLTGTPFAERPLSLWGTAGIPGAGSYDTTLNGVILSSTSALVNGQIPFTDSVNPTYLARFIGYNGSTAGTIYLYDRLWHNGGFTITSTGAQSIASPTWPARDVDGTTNGNGVFLALEISAAAGAAAPTITISYTNSNGVSGRSAFQADPTANSPITGSTFRISLQAGDVGVRSVQSLTLSSSWLSGTMNLVAYRPIAVISSAVLCVEESLDILTGGFVRMYNGSVPYVLYEPSGATAAKIHGSVSWTQG